jgi:hypothetical protein
MVRWRNKKQGEARDEAEVTSVADWMHGLSPFEGTESNPSPVGIVPKNKFRPWPAYF